MRPLHRNALVLGQFHQYATCRRWVQEGNPFALGAEPRRLVDEADSRGPTALHHRVKIGHGEADVMDPCTALGQELPDWRVGALRLEQLDQRVAACNGCDTSAVGIGQRDLWHPQYVTVKREGLGQVAHGDTDVCDARPARSFQGRVRCRRLKRH